MKINLPELSLVVLVGASGAGKSSFARRHFLATETISSDFCRALVCDDENSLDATNDAFSVLHFIAGKRLKRGKLCVVDATNVQSAARAPLVALAREHYVLPVAIVLDVPEAVCLARNETRPDRDFGPHVVRNHARQLRQSLRNLKREGFRHVWILGLEDMENAEIVREPLWNNRREMHGPFDIIGDVHGCADELELLLQKLGYVQAESGWRHAERTAIFLGDLVDRGPRVVDTLNIVHAMCESGAALCVAGNHDVKLVRAMNGKNVKIAHGLAESLAQIAPQSEEWKNATKKFLDGLISHYVLDDGRLVVAHAGLKEVMHGRAAGPVREFALYGETTGETDEFGLPIRYPWAQEYRGAARVVYGHTPVPEPEWLNGTINIDTGCVFGGKLTALRLPEEETISVDAAQVYSEPARPFLVPAEEFTAQQQHDDVLDVADVSGKKLISTRWLRAVTIREENSAAALEIMSRFAADPRWLIHLPPTMSPCATHDVRGAEPDSTVLFDVLEHPAEAFADYARHGISRVICEEKHMGSRAIVVVCRDEDAARRRFGVPSGDGIITTRTGRRFFDDETESALLHRLRASLDKAGTWETLNTDWLCLDCELMPWSAKAQELLLRQYAPVGVAAKTSLAAVDAALAQASANGVDVSSLEKAFSFRAQSAGKYVDAYRRYCWDVQSVADLKLAPFHILASEGAVHHNRDHIWHMETIKLFCLDETLLATPYITVDLDDETSRAAGIAWWQKLTNAGGEGMVVKPIDFLAQDEKGLVQPAIKVRGREYLRIIYGPEYDAPENIARLRRRSLGAKRSLALREFALGQEALERFVAREPLRRVHECVFGVLALESEPVDPRL